MNAATKEALPVQQNLSLSLLFVVVVKGRKSVVGRTLNNAAGDEEGRERERERLRRSKLTWERRMRRKVGPGADLPGSERRSINSAL